MVVRRSYQTKSLLTIPVLGGDGECVAVIQVLPTVAVLACDVTSCWDVLCCDRGVM